MTTEAPGPPEENDNKPRPRSRRPRARFPLFLKLLILTAMLVFAVIGVAIGITINRANFIASETVNKAISGAATLFKEFERTRLQELSIGAYTLARDVPFVAYVENAQQPSEGAAGLPEAPQTTPSDTAVPAEAQTSDVVSMLDQLGERKAVLRSDVLMVTDVDGVVLARTDEPTATKTRGEDLYETQPLVRATVESTEMNPLTGTMEINGKLYHAAVAPLSIGAGGVRSGYIINAYEIDEAFANRIAKSTQADVIFFPEKRDEATTTPRSSDAPPAERVVATGDVSKMLASGRMLPPHQVRLGNDVYLVTGEPLRFGGKSIGAAVFLRSLDRELAPFRAIQRTLVIAGGLALLVAFIISWIISRRLTRPIEELAVFAQAVTEGDYSINPTTHRSDEVGILAKAFAQMVSSLRDKAELEELYAQMTSRDEARKEDRELAPAATEEGTIMVTDLRGVGVGGRPAGDVLDAVSNAMRLQESEVARQEGEVREIVGHRLVCTFKGDRAILHAIRAARAINEELAMRSRGGEALTVGIGIATGDFVTGSVELSDKHGLAIIGNAPLLALLYAWEAPSGAAFLSLETAQAASAELLGAATREEIKLRWLPNPLPVISLPLHTLTTGVMQQVGGATLSSTAQMPTMRMDGGSMPAIVAPSAADLSPGILFANRYMIESIIGRGGMGVVYRATDTQLDETVAIKTLPGDAMSRSPEELERFKREIRLARKITHRNVLRTFDYGEAHGVYFISMEFVRGYTLWELMEEQTQIAPRLAMSVSRQICRGLQAAHEEGIIHRDIKPQNVLVDQKGQAKLMDFGIARMAETKEAMTSAGLIVGTPHYMSPEQVQGKTLDARSDVYSMGVMIYEMLCGAKPFDSTSLTGVLTAHIMEKPKPPIEIRPEIGAEINRIVMKCLEKEASKRYADAGALLNDLDRLQSMAMAA